VLKNEETASTAICGSALTAVCRNVCLAISQSSIASCLHGPTKQRPRDLFVSSLCFLSEEANKKAGALEIGIKCDKFINSDWSPSCVKGTNWERETRGVNSTQFRDFKTKSESAYMCYIFFWSQGVGGFWTGSLRSVAAVPATVSKDKPFDL